MVPQTSPTPIWIDALSVLFATGGGQSLRHTPWLLARLGSVIQAVEDGIVVFRKCSGLLNPTNSLTKYVKREEFMRDMNFFGNVDAAPPPPARAATPPPPKHETAYTEVSIAALHAMVASHMLSAIADKGT